MSEERYEDSQLYRIRHSAAHVMAEAMIERFPGAKVAIGPPIEDGFYYDFDLPRPATAEDLKWVEKRMKKIIGGAHKFAVREVSPGDFGLQECDASKLRVDSAEASAKVIRDVLAGHKGPARDIVLLNSAAAITVSGAAGSIADGLAKAAESVDSGKAADVLASLVSLTNSG